MSAAREGQTHQVVIVGGVAGGMSTATRLRRLDADAGITVIERSGHVSFANCGLPYFVGGLIEEEDDLTLQTPGAALRPVPPRCPGQRRGRRHRPERPHRHHPLDAHRRGACGSPTTSWC